MNDNRQYDTETVYERLREYGEMVKDLEYQGERLERLKVKLIGVGAQALTDMPKSPSPNNDKMTDLVAQKIELEEDMKEMADEVKAERKAIEKAIRSLKSAEQRAVIRGRFIDGERADSVTELLFGGKEDFLDKQMSYQRRMFSIQAAAVENLAAYFGMYLEPSETA